MMSDGMLLTIDGNGVASVYDDTYDITIHCDTQEEQNEVKDALENARYWTPCRVCLPKEDGVYLVTIDEHCLPPMCRNVYTLWWESELQEWQYEKDKVNFRFPHQITAWMPLPEGYKEPKTE